MVITGAAIRMGTQVGFPGPMVAEAVAEALITAVVIMMVMMGGMGGAAFQVPKFKILQAGRLFLVVGVGVAMGVVVEVVMV